MAPVASKPAPDVEHRAAKPLRTRRFIGIHVYYGTCAPGDPIRCDGRLRYSKMGDDSTLMPALATRLLGHHEVF